MEENESFQTVFGLFNGQKEISEKKNKKSWQKEKKRKAGKKPKRYAGKIKKKKTRQGGAQKRKKRKSKFSIDSQMIPPIQENLEGMENLRKIMPQNRMQLYLARLRD